MYQQILLEIVYFLPAFRCSDRIQKSINTGILQAIIHRRYVRNSNVNIIWIKIFVVNSLLKNRKKEAFSEIIRVENIHPDELLCIGNSISSEIADAIEMKATACYFEYGENRGAISSLSRQPDFHIKHHRELISTCRL